MKKTNPLAWTICAQCKILAVFSFFRFNLRTLNLKVFAKAKSALMETHLVNKLCMRLGLTFVRQGPRDPRSIV
jgi:hypothetical protein